MNIYELLHLQSKNTKRHAETYVGTLRPEWTVVEYKNYERCPKIDLPPPRDIALGLTETLKARTSTRKFTADLSIGQLSDILYWSLGSKILNASDDVVESRMYPSGGRRFPIESYLFLFADLGTLASGIYHYRPTEHKLSLVRKMDFDDKMLDTITIFGKQIRAKAAVVHTAVFERSKMKYGERSYLLTLLEAGCASHNVTLTATALGVGSLHMGGATDTYLEELLEIDGVHESYVHSVFLG